MLDGNGQYIALLGEIEPCYPDFDADGQLTIFDFLAFQNAFDAGDLHADCDEDGSLTIFDFLCFQNAFDAAASKSDDPDQPLSGRPTRAAAYPSKIQT